MSLHFKKNDEKLKICEKMLNNNCIFELVHNYITFYALKSMYSYIVSYNKNT